jgi:tRNA modification GTPase
MIIHSDGDTIAAISTPYGESGIGIVRVSGGLAREVGLRLFRPRDARTAFESHRVHYGEIVDPVDGRVIDEVLVLFMAAPRTYTREDVVEIHCHGGYLVLRRILECVIREGARLAEPGEFTKRAFLSGRIDLAQAEAVIETIKARTVEGLRVANEQLGGRLSGEIEEMRSTLLGGLAEIEGRLDFPDENGGESDWEDVRGVLGSVSKRLSDLIGSFAHGRVLREGVVAAIVGKTNVGKSSLLNALVGDERAIVTDVPGTTRDVIEERMSLWGVLVRVVDTAGMRNWRNEAEREGIERTRRMIGLADLVIVVVDQSRRLTGEDRDIFSRVRGKKKVVVVNKIDLPRKLGRRGLTRFGPETVLIEVSALTGENMEGLREAVAKEALEMGLDRSEKETVIMETRHKRALEVAEDALGRAMKEIERGASPEIVALEVRGAMDGLGEIVGETVTEEVLDEVFRRFCVGK